MKVLLLTDIHSDYDAAKAVGYTESPDLVLDCGDHDAICNLFGQVPHFYIEGNHIPLNMDLRSGDLSLPNLIPIGAVIEFSRGNDKLKFAGMGGIYSSKSGRSVIGEKDLANLQGIPPKGIDVLLLHECPLTVDSKLYTSSLAPRVVAEIDRIKPRYVFAGHGGPQNPLETSGGVKVIPVAGITRGYGILNVDVRSLDYKPVISYWGSSSSSSPQ